MATVLEEIDVLPANGGHVCAIGPIELMRRWGMTIPTDSSRSVEHMPSDERLWSPWFAWRPVIAEMILSDDPNCEPWPAPDIEPRKKIWFLGVERRKERGQWSYRIHVRPFTQDDDDARAY